MNERYRKIELTYSCWDAGGPDFEETLVRAMYKLLADWTIENYALLTDPTPAADAVWAP